MNEDESEHSRREVLASAGIGVLGTGGIAGYLRFVHEPAPPLEVEITDGSEYVTGVTVPGTRKIIAFSKWDPNALEIEVSDALGTENVIFELFHDGVKLGWYAVTDPPETVTVEYQAKLTELTGEYTADLYGGEDLSEWGESDGPSNRPPDAEAAFTISRSEER